MNIAMLHWGFPPIIGGVETHLTILCSELVKEGHKVSLLTGAVEGVKSNYTWNKINIVRTPLMDLNWLYERGVEELGGDIRSVYAKFIDETRPDIIHTHNMHYFSKLHIKLLERVAEIRKIPLVLTAHNSWDNSLCLDICRGIKWGHIIAVSHFIKREICGYGLDPDKVAVVHHGIDTERFMNLKKEDIYKKYPKLKDRKVIFHPARMGLGKGCDISVKALRLIKKEFPDVMLVLAGTKHIIDWGRIQQKDIAYILHLIGRFGLKEDVLIDVYTREEVAELYEISEFTFYPSTSHEPFGLTMLESMVSGKPIIVTNAGGMPEVIEDGVNGYIVRARDHEMLAKRSIELLKDDNLRRQLGENGRRIVAEKYSAERMTDDILKVYENVLGG